MDGYAQQLLEHPRRAWFVWGAAAAVGLVLTLPAWDAWSAARADQAALRADRVAAEAAAAAMPELKARLTEMKERPEGTDGPRGLDELGAEALRETVVRQINETGCKYRRLTIAAPAEAPWGDAPPPLPGLAAAPPAAKPGDAEEKPKFELVTRRLEAEAVGSPRQVAELLGWAAAAHPHAIPLQYELQFEQESGAVHVNFTLLLTAVRPVKAAAAG